MGPGPSWLRVCAPVFLLALAAFLQIGIARNKTSADEAAKGAKGFRAEASPERLERGRYLVEGTAGIWHSIAQCNDCHAPANEDGSAKTEMMFGGGSRNQGAWGDVVSPNITSDPSGISHYDEAMFIKTIRTGHVPEECAN